MKFGLTDAAIARIHGIFARHQQVERAILYGSRAKGNYKNGSDIDLTLVGGADLNLQVMLQIMNEIDDLLLPYSFDLSLYTMITDPEVIAHIQRVGVVFYAKAGEARPA